MLDPSSEYPVVNMNQYIIFSDLPKIRHPLKLINPKYENFTYGPYEPVAETYKWPYPDAEELTQRIIALKEIIDNVEKAATDMKKKNGDKPSKEFRSKISQLISMKAHIADLYAMKYAKTQLNKYIYESIHYYKDIYKSLPTKIRDQVSINMANSLIHAEDYATAFPIIKILKKKEGSKFFQQIKDTFIEFYFMSDRFHKADDVIQMRIKQKELDNESLRYLVRAGDVMFFLKRFRDASEWYQTYLKPNENSSMAENLSWLYLAESLHQIGDKDVSRKVYKAMQPYFEGTEYEPVIKYRLAESEEEKKELIALSTRYKTGIWMRIELITEQFIANPKLITSDRFLDLLTDYNLKSDLKKQVLLLQGYAYRNENKFYKAIEVFHKLELKEKNRFIANEMNNLIIETMVKKGLSTKDSDDAFKFLRYMLTLKFNLKAHDPDMVYQLLYHNLDLIGLENASAELTMRIIEQSVHQKKDQAYIQFKLAENMHDAYAYRQSIKTLKQIDLKLLDEETKEKYHELLIVNLIETDQKIEALDALAQWEKDGSSAERSFWIALKKIEILYGFNRYKEVLTIIDDTIGKNRTDDLPKQYLKSLRPLMAYQVIIYNKLGRHNECLISFYRNEDMILKTKIKDDVIFAAVASALSMKKTRDIKKLTAIGKSHLDEATFSWLDKWTKGEMWINQVNRYLDHSSIAIKGEKQ